MSSFATRKQLDLTLYLMQCPHRSGISTENCAWCNECKAWINGVEVGDVQVDWEDNGDITVLGGGYAPHEANVSH